MDLIMEQPVKEILKSGLWQQILYSECMILLGKVFDCNNEMS